MKKGKRYKTNKKYIVLRLALIVSLVVSLIVVGSKITNNYKGNKANKEIKEILNEVNQEDNVQVNTRIKTLKKLQKQNSDIVALIRIEGTNINYPVLQGEDNDFYMTHNYKKEYSKDGSLFLNKDYDWNLPSTNLLIYGHNNIGSTEMFVELMKYKEEDFYNNHRIINFTTVGEDAEYEIISVFLSRVYYKSEKNVFRYYYFNKNGKPKSYFIHRLVAKAFIPNPNKYKEINHIDKNRKNNDVNNLEWCTRTYNNVYSKAKAYIDGLND